MTERWGGAKATTRSPSALGLAVLAGAAGCGGGLPLLHPARTLPPGDVRASAGLSGNVPLGGLADALRTATNEAASNGGAPGPAGTDATYARGAIVAASVGPGLAPFVAARVGLGAAVEAGIGYTGRSVRADVRRSFDVSPHWALSVGAGGSAALYGHPEGVDLPQVDLAELHGVGADLPVLLGYQSDTDLYMLWLGGRAGWEHVTIGTLTSEPSGVAVGGSPIPLSATRFWASGIVGVAVGFRHVHVAMEIDVGYASIAGDYNQTHARVTGPTLAPGTALWWTF